MNTINISKNMSSVIRMIIANPYSREVAAPHFGYFVDREEKNGVIECIVSTRAFNHIIKFNIDIVSKGFKVDYCTDKWFEKLVRDNFNKQCMEIFCESLQY